MLSAINHIHARRADLRQAIDVAACFKEWEETCVPSYCHPNLAAAYVSWWRLFAAVRLAKRLCPGGTSALDFGSSVGELGRLLPRSLSRYDFIEENDAAARYLLQHQPQARRQSLEAIPQAAYDWVFAIDALEHNDDYPGLLARLARSLTPTGVLVISGPTENWLYRLGRRIAGFDGHYHTTTIFAIEDAARKILRCRKVTTIVPGLPLFRLSVWSAPSSPA
jgi:SAM-dependent methyltransferase